MAAAGMPVSVVVFSSGAMVVVTGPSCVGG
jgi:hypothetical protein